MKKLTGIILLVTVSTFIGHTQTKPVKALTYANPQGNFKLIDTIDQHTSLFLALSPQLFKQKPIELNNKFVRDAKYFRLQLMGSDVEVMQIDYEGNIWIVPSFFCKCDSCRNKTKLEIVNTVK